MSNRIIGGMDAVSDRAILRATEGVHTMASRTDLDPPGKTCSNGWKITGYFPAQEDFMGTPQQIEVQGSGPGHFPERLPCGDKDGGLG
jgi:hypothetical protein